MEEHDVMGEISLKEIFDVVFRWRWLIILVTLAAVLTSAVVSNFFITPIYRSSAMLMVANDDAARTIRPDDNLEDVVGRVSRLPEMNMNTYVSQFQSTALLERVIHKLGLRYSSEMLAKLIKTTVVKDTRLIEVSVEHSDPYTAALIANTLSEEFIEFISDVNQQRMGKSLVFLHEQREEVARQLDETREKYQEYQYDPRSLYIVQTELDSKLSDVTRYQSQIVQAQIEYEQLVAGRNELLRRLQNESQIIVVFAEGGGGEEIINPVYVSLRQSLDEKSVQVNEKQALIKSIGKAVEKLEQQVPLLQEEMTEKREYERRMNSDIQRLEKAYDLFTEKIIQAQITQSFDIGEANLALVVGAVTPSSPIKPNKPLNMALAAVLAMMLSVLLAFLFEFLNTSFKDAADVEKQLKVPVLGHIPQF